jgi:hypothetical protein
MAQALNNIQSQLVVQTGVIPLAGCPNFTIWTTCKLDNSIWTTNFDWTVQFLTEPGFSFSFLLYKALALPKFL